MITAQDLFWGSSSIAGVGGMKPAIKPMSASAPCSPVKPAGGISRTRSCEPFHVAHKVPVGDGPYVRAKRVQLVEKDPDRAIALFWAAINAGDRVDSALKDMAVVMKQQNRAEEAIEAIRSLRVRCSEQAQESLDNILLDLFKRCGRLDDQIALLRHKLVLIQQGLAFNGKRTKTARSQGRKFQVSLEQEATRLLGNLGWALMQQDRYAEAEQAYRRALQIGADNNKMCNLGICLMKQGRVSEARETLSQVKPAHADGPRGVDSHLKAFARAQEMLRDLETKLNAAAACLPSAAAAGGEKGAIDAAFWAFDPSSLFVGGSSAIWQPQPCADMARPSTPKQKQHKKQQQQEQFADENVNVNSNILLNALLPPTNKPKKPSTATTNNAHNLFAAGPSAAELLPLGGCTLGVNNNLNVAAPPFYSTKFSGNDHTTTTHLHQQQHPGRPVLQQVPADPLGNLHKRSRPANAGVVGKKKNVAINPAAAILKETTAYLCNSPATPTPWKGVLPDAKAFDDAIFAAALGPILDAAAAEEPKTPGNGTSNKSPLMEGKMGKRLRVFQDITQVQQPIMSPRA